MPKQFQVAAGSIVGRNHSDPLVAKPNQDAFVHHSFEDMSFAIVCDGCSSGTHSEVGASLGARLIEQSISTRLRDAYQASQNDPEGFLERVRQDVLAEIRVLANRMGGSFTETIGDYFLFTVMGALVTPEWTCVFSNGDGVYFVNGQAHSIGPFPGNEPPYFAYQLVQSKFEPQALRFEVREFFSTHELSSLLIGSDGVSDLVSTADKNLPGRDELLGDICQFWELDRYFTNSDNVRRRLALANQRSVRLDPDGQRLVRENGLLPDDTTLVVIRRKTAEESDAD